METSSSHLVVVVLCLFVCLFVVSMTKHVKDFIRIIFLKKMTFRSEDFI